jgi:hypothetical protein
MSDIDDVLALPDDEKPAAQHGGQEPAESEYVPEEMTPLGQLMMNNQDVINRTIEEFGPAVVANWFMNAGAMIAAVYDLDATGDDEIPFAATEETK